jgi:predicted PurR-regulated permease PerM
VKLSPLAILIGAEVAGVLGALVAIPVGGTIQILLDHWQAHRRRIAREGGTRKPSPRRMGTATRAPARTRRRAALP